ncbi:nucleotidyl transferase AbiEii/AbiGii toxin family protein [Adlercreutzia sp. ZJ473]|uniref:nucleotidyl transferase AbiEii/AbiGii toxin family protein n=1 Tax=Adlercreutzia sp. ZJ473 TaxID=2722822 RepID=UPI0015530A60|nr:nucleotidyl transferase AbiEii/AbiGii toxin family protein [Adlercreutzia sp. ZJ473]
MSRYASARALEQAIREAARKSPRDTNRAIEGFYLDRLLCRVFSEAKPAFILKGGQSQLARRIDARESRDTDLVGTSAEIEESLAKLKELASIDLDDFFEFRFIKADPISVSQEYRTGYRVEFLPVIGRTKRLNPLHVDLVVDQTPPENWMLVSPASRLEVEGLPVYDYALQTVEERIADKVCATMQLYDGRPSSRVKDLADLAVAMCTDVVDADILAEKIKRESILRGMNAIERFEVPGEWVAFRGQTYAKEARACSASNMPTSIEQAVQMVADWLAPVMSGAARGKTWLPDKGRWR